MLISIWGRDGLGKSKLADTLGYLFSKKGITAVIDTDFTQPTLPLRLNGQYFNQENSLGKAISGIGLGEITRYLHQHSKRKTLFYAGLTYHDDYLSYEIGLEADVNAQDFVEGCKEYADTVILDLSGQRTDPFVPGALTNSDQIIIPITPDFKGVCWYNSVKSLLEIMNTENRILPIATMTEKQHSLSTVEKAIGTRFSAVLPFVREFRQESSINPFNASSLSASRYIRQVKRLYKKLKGGASIEDLS